MGQPEKSIIIVAGDPSGDIHAANLVRELKRLAPHLRFSGLGGPQMLAAGVEIYQDLTKLSSVGFFEFLEHLGDLKKAFKTVLKQIDLRKPSAVILVDYAGFNLRLAKELKKRSQKILYYISPQVWASREGRVKSIARYVDKLFVFFKFEQEFYRKRNVSVEFIGHPLLDMSKPHSDPERFLLSVGLDPHKLTVALLPGSRAKEVQRHLPLMITSARQLSEEYQRLQFVILKAEHLELSLFEPHLRGCNFPIKLIQNQTYEGINAAQMCLVASGTATLEIAIFEKPMVVIYQTSFLTWLLARMLIKIPHIAMVNVIARKKIVPELVQADATPDKIVEACHVLFRDELKIAEMKTELKRIRLSLGEPGAARRAAGKMLELIEPSLPPGHSEKIL